MTKRLQWWVSVVALIIAAIAVDAGLGAAPAGAVVTGPVVTYTYTIATVGSIRSDVNLFAAHVASTYADPRGWSLGGSIRFVRVASGGDFTVWLASAASVPGFSSSCSATLSCRVGRNVIINDDRWSFGALAPWPASLDEFRYFEVNHETGHWLGLPHPCMGGPCVPPGQLAPVMMQQPKGLFGDLPNWWPFPSERQRIAGPRGLPIRPAPEPGLVATPTGSGYWIAASTGQVLAFGAAASLGSIAANQLGAPLVDMAGTPTGTGPGYWLVASDGGIFTFGAAGFFGSMGGHFLNRPIVGMAPTLTGHGYWLVASDGGIFSFGDAQFFGSMGGHVLSQPIVGMAASPTGRGYWLVASDGGIFAFGDARFFGSMGGKHLNQPIVGMAASRTGQGYWLVASDGGIFAFGDAAFVGSAGGINISAPVAAMAVTPSGKGYWLQGADGGIFTFGDAPFYGSAFGMASASASAAGVPPSDVTVGHAVGGTVDNVAG
jgi:hypothetical protein